MSTRAYGAYGESMEFAHGARLAFAGELAERESGWYLLGDRPYSPVLRRFLAPDPDSPFHDGGVNRYAYCSGDPINWIDPTGNAWTDWLAAGLMVALSVVATVVSAGVLAGPLAAATTTAMTAAAAAGGGLSAAAAAAPTAAVVTPGLVSAATAMTLDVVSTVAAVGSVASMAAHNQKANAIFGWVSMASGIGSGGASVVAAKQMKRAASMAGVARRASAASSAGSRASSTATAHTAVNAVKAVTPLATPGASPRNSTRNATHSLAAPDANANLPQLRRQSAVLAANGARDGTVYVGTPGSRQEGRPPHWRQRDPTGRLYRNTIETTIQVGSSAGLNVAAVDVARSTREHLRGRLSEDGIHVVVGGHGLADNAAIQRLNVSSILSDHMFTVRAGT